MNENTNISIEELIKLWTKSTCTIFREIDKTQKEIQLRKKFIHELSEKGIKDLEICTIDEDVCTICYYYEGNKVTKQMPLK